MSKKTKQLKTVIIKPAKLPKFNLSMEDPTENTRIVLALQGLKVNAGWTFLMQIFEENKSILSEIIICKKDIDGNPLTEAQADEARFKYGYLKELMGKPDEFLKKLAPHTDPIDTNDPYDQGKTEKE